MEKGFNNYSVGALSVERETLVNKSGAQAESLGGERDHFRGYYSVLWEGNYRGGSTGKTSGPAQGRWGGAAVLEEASQRGEIPRKFITSL